MKKLILLFGSFLCVQSLTAQHWTEMPATTRNLEQIRETQEKTAAAQKAKAEKEEKYVDNGRIRKEDKNYHFSRWLYYWENHLDQHGNMVSPARTMQEWNRYRQSKKQHRVMAKTTADQSQWEFKGPSYSPGAYRGLGRINVIAFHPTDSNTLIIGSAGGGAWRSVNDGMTWTPLYNNLPVLGVSDVDYNPQNPSVIYICTGDRDASDTYSVGIMKSTDGGQSWNMTGLQYAPSQFVLTNELLINRLDSNSMLVATSEGLKKSYDGGQSWTDVSNGHFKDIEYHPTDTSIIYAASYENNSNIYRSTDGGATWSKMTSFTSTRRIALAVTPADPHMVMAVVATGSSALKGIYRSADSAGSFTRIYGDENDCSLNILATPLTLDVSTCNGQAWYDLCIAISPTNPNQILVGGVNTYQSMNGGLSWEIVNQWYSGLPGVETVHADKHFLSFHPIRTGVLYEGNDGGIYKTSNPAALLWNDLTNGMGITQFYRNAVADVAPFVLGGSQDNGSKRINFTGTLFNELTGGDGMECQIDYIDPGIFYTSIQNGEINRTTNNGSSFDNISNNIPGNPTGDWITPFLLHPTDPITLIAGYRHIYVSYDRGDSWVDISPSFSISGPFVRRLAMTPADDQMIVAVTGNSTIRYTQNFGASWTTVPGVPSGRISDIAIDPWDKNKLWVTFSGYGTTKVQTYDLNTGWMAMNDSLPDVPVQCFLADPVNNTKYIGTDVGVFYRDTSMNHWEMFSNGLPTVEVTDLGVNQATGEIWAATYGRGMWKSPKHMTATGIADMPYAFDVITVAPNPNRGDFRIVTSNTALLGQAVEVTMVNLTGQVIMKQHATFGSDGQLQVKAGDLPKGTYIVDVNKSGVRFARTKMIAL